MQDSRRRQRALSRYRLIAPLYDALFEAAGRRLRREAVRRLELRPGQAVLDVGCGTGLSFDLLEQAVGPQGRVIGVELSPDMLARAQQKVAARSWQNVTLVEAAAEEADIPDEVDAVLFHYTHDIMQSEAALRNVLSHLKSGGRVVAAGGKRASRWWQQPANLVVPFFLPFVTTLEGATRPWAKLEELLGSRLAVDERRLGVTYIASGVKP
ncbi:MAG: class I SAM-dependent methyltransferase [Chloroflexota bacterium]|nr:class I SAM-dependent methyltransferase [Chloroflexota bacterium]